MNDFSANIMSRLKLKGIKLIGLQAIPTGKTWFNPDRGYILDDNGTCRVLAFLEVLELARS